MKMNELAKKILPTMGSMGIRNVYDEYKKKYSLEPADLQELNKIFVKYSKVSPGGVRYMPSEKFIRDYLGMQKDDEYNKDTLSLLAGVVDQTNDGRISFGEFVAFEHLLHDPNRYHKLIFQLFDSDGKGFVSFDDFETVIKKTDLYDKIPFNFNTDFISEYFGPDKTRCVPFFEFFQLLQGFEKEYQCQAFMGEMVNGEIPATKFAEVMKNLRGHLLTPKGRDNLLTVAASGEPRHQVSYNYYREFNNMLDNIPVLHEVSNEVSDGKRYKEIKKDDFLNAILESNSKVTPLQVDIFYNLCDVDRRGQKTVSDVHHTLSKFDVYKVFATERHDEDGLHWIDNFLPLSLAFISIATGAAVVHPFDLVKTRMQNQRAVVDSEKLYKNSFECAWKVIRNEGPRGMYRGLSPQLLGILPEKAIKLTTNEKVRGLLSDKDGFISLPYEFVAGACGGAAQMSITNPLEIVKIRLQVAGEQLHTHGKRVTALTSIKRVTALTSIKELGPSGLYKGAQACLMRDIPFSAIFFPAYAHLKLYFADENGQNGAGSLFGSAMLAGGPAAFLVTPADVIKTRLQVKPRNGQQSYRGVFDAFRKIFKEEGGRAFWKGSGARVLKLSPQFGITMVTYDFLQGFFGFGRSTTDPDLSFNPDHIGGMRVAVETYAGIETKFGLCLPKFRTPQKVTLNPTPPPTKTD